MAAGTAVALVRPYFQALLVPAPRLCRRRLHEGTLWQHRGARPRAGEGARTGRARSRFFSRHSSVCTSDRPLGAWVIWMKPSFAVRGRHCAKRQQGTPRRAMVYGRIGRAVASAAAIVRAQTAAARNPQAGPASIASWCNRRCISGPVFGRALRGPGLRTLRGAHQHRPFSGGDRHVS